MATKAELGMWARLDALTKERDELLAKTAPLEREKENFCIERELANRKAIALADEINAIVHPRMQELMSELGMVSKALSGKARPAAEV